MFNLIEYIQRLTRENRYATQYGFRFTTCSGINYLEGVLDSLRAGKGFVCCSDVSDGEFYQNGGGWFRRRVLTVFILQRFRPDSPTDRESKMRLCRELFRQFMTRHLLDEGDLAQQSAFLNVRNVRHRELGGQFLNGATGLYYMLTMDEPVDLCFNEAEWTPN